MGPGGNDCCTAALEHGLQGLKYGRMAYVWPFDENFFVLSVEEDFLLHIFCEPRRTLQLQ
jgi:hypothetical protein